MSADSLFDEPEHLVDGRRVGKIGDRAHAAVWNAHERGVDTVARAVAYVRQCSTIIPELGIVLGTGLGGVSNLLEQSCTIPYADIPGFPRTSAIGHRGELLLGMLNGLRVVILEGRSHLYEGVGWESVQFPTRVLHGLGVTGLVLTNAVGGLHADMQVGEIRVIDDHFSLMFGQDLAGPPWNHRNSPLPGQLDTSISGRAGCRTVYDAQWIEEALSLARQLRMPLRRSVYAAMTGPNYETRAEYRMLRRLGADTVGMSTFPEACAAAELGLRTIAFSMVTNVCNPDALLETDGAEVAAAAALAAPKLGQLIAAFAAATARWKRR